MTVSLRAAAHDLLHGPDMRTPVPGPGSRAYLARQEIRESNARSYPRRLPIAVERAQGAYIEDVDGNVFLDFLTGAGALPLGHSHPAVVDAVTRQLATHVHGLDFPTPVKDDFVDAHLALLPGAMRDRMKMHFCGPTGANAVEAALKLCKIATGRSEVVTFQGGFHGSTHGAMAVTGLVSARDGVANLMPGAHFFPYSYCYRCPVGLDPRSCDTNCAGYLVNSLRDSHGGVQRPAAALLEMVQGEGGVIPATLEFVRTVRQLTRELDIPLIVDEVQTGYGRTGSWFAFEQYGIEPDVIVLSKATGGIGLPVAVLLYDRRLDRWQPGAHIGTFRGHQLAFAASVAALREMRRLQVPANARAQGAYLLERLRALRRRHPVVGDVRGKGLMLGLEIVDPGSGRPDGELAARIQNAALQRGLILEVGGRQDAVVRMLPPLNISRQIAATGADVLEAALEAVTGSQPPQSRSTERRSPEE